jgi:predicted GNAT superfamily acetyltransferase
MPTDIYELEERIGQPGTELKDMFVYRHASKIVEQGKYCGYGYHLKSSENEQCKSGLVDLCTRFPTFHRDLYDALSQVKEDFEEVFEEHKVD